jgi:hypothetical protein
MSCGVALAVSLLLSDPNIAMAAALPPPRRRCAGFSGG